jgi:hypothetical protein
MEDDIERPMTTDDPQGPGGGQQQEKAIPAEKTALSEIQIATKPKTENTPQGPVGKQKTEEMEVHHHPQLHHKRKKFTEYFLEFLMIFLAVTLGFFAESFREHLVEKNKEKQYMKEIVENLKYDTIRCGVNGRNNIQFAIGMDSLRAELKAAIAGSVNSNALYYYVLQYANEGNQAVFNTSAITELKNSGSLRLIENKKIVSEIADYYERQISATSSYIPVVTDLSRSKADIFSMRNLDNYITSYDRMDNKTYSNNYDYHDILHHEPALTLLQSNPAALEHFYNILSDVEVQIKKYTFWLHYCKAAAAKLIEHIQKEYHLENE